MYLFAAVGLTASGAVVAQQSAVLGDPRDFTGIWWNGPSSGPSDLELIGDAPVLTAAGRAAYAESAPRKRNMDVAETNPYDVGNCVPVGIPRIWAQPYPFEITVRPDLVAILYEHLGGWRVAYLDEAPPTAETALSLFHYGNSGARWDGDTLVIESTAYHEDTYLDETGLPLTENLRTVERIRKLDDETLEVVTTIDDPEYYAEPWTVRATFSRDPAARIEEYVCGYGAFETRYQPPPAGGDGLAPAGVGLGVSAADAEVVPDFSGVWRGTRARGEVDEDGVMLTAAGERIPFQPWSREVFYDTVNDATGYIDNRVRCLPEGAVDMWSSVWAFRIVQQPDIVYFLIDYDNQVRRVLINAEFPDDLKPTWNGTSIGRWEDGALVVETRGFNDKTALLTLPQEGADGALISRTARRFV